MPNFTSCDRLQEDLPECVGGLRLRFVYDYNMEFANAFPSQVDCLTVLFYDKDGNYVATRTNESPDLADENWRMEVDLAPGDYDVLAYGGMECHDSSFYFVTSPESTK
ncbi:MAG: FimB/Mfa2 family fimbrial subunit [Lactobacillus sp.]|nr:FimB/Mfa2 family fimbrial subunit [Lactobacillus sp.]